jgi:hypothetical protein
MIGGQPIEPIGTHVLNEAKDFAKGAIQGAADVSTPKILQQLFKQYRGQPNTLKDAALAKVCVARLSRASKNALRLPR